jgi:D-amino-acid dehydrogenase
MKILIVGAGLIGVTTAYALRLRGHEVTVLDRQPGPARETSFANAALLTPSMAEPWNSPGCWRVLLASLGRADTSLLLRWHALPGLIGWGARFLRNSSRASFERSTISNLRLALYSMRCMHELRERTAFQFGHRSTGTLRIYRDTSALDKACASADRLVPHGLRYSRHSTEKMLTLEPALEPIARELKGAIHYHADEVGDAHRFCVALAEHARGLGVEFRFNVEVLPLETRAGAVPALASRAERFIADRYVIAAGSYSRTLLRGLGISLPVQPAKGYSITFRSNEGQLPPLRIPVADDDLHAVVTPLDGAIRVAGTAEFTGYRLAPDPARVRNLTTLLGRVLPQGRFDLSQARTWCGLRPMSVDGLPIIGAASVPNLFIHTGHGHLGWTMAAGSAELLSDLITGRAPSIDPAPYSPARFMR